MPYTDEEITEVVIRVGMQKMQPPLGEPITVDNHPDVSIPNARILAKTAPGGYAARTVIGGHAANVGIRVGIARKTKQ